MHASVMSWIGEQVQALDLANRSAVEIGSANINGTVRGYFCGHYLGVDVVQAPGVDLVVTSGEPIPLPDACVDLVVSTECLEHDPRPWRTVAEARRLLRPGGVLLLTCRGYDERGCFPVHNEPDFYRYSAGALRVLLDDAGFEQVTVVPDPQVPGWLATAAVPLIP